MHVDLRQAGQLSRCSQRRVDMRQIAAENLMNAKHLRYYGVPVDEPTAPGHTIPFIARQTRACLNFEVKDGALISAVAEISIYDVEIGQVRFRRRAASGRRDP
jgi:hypothetical protein